MLLFLLLVPVLVLVLVGLVFHVLVVFIVLVSYPSCKGLLLRLTCLASTICFIGRSGLSRLSPTTSGTIGREGLVMGANQASKPEHSLTHYQPVN